MAESSFYPEAIDSDMETLKEALQAQQQLLQKLYFELDEEREASSSATSEAMSMILRLQGEKAQMQMEASQYKRESEQKMYMAEESLAIFEDLMYQKEMEIACLEFQIQAYKCKLLGISCSDLSIPECRNEPVVVKRQDSLPSLYLKEYFPKKSAIERDRSAMPASDLIPKIEATNANQEVNFVSMDLQKKAGASGSGDLNLYWEQIRKLDGQVKEISDGKILHRAHSTNSRNRQFRSCSLPPPDPEDSRLSSSPPSNGIAMSVDPNAVSSSSVLDKFEVPQNENGKARGGKEMERKKLVFEGEKRYRKLVTEEDFEFQAKDKNEFRNKVPVCPKHKDKSSKQRERTIIDSQFSLPSTSSVAFDYQLDIQGLKQRIERLERNRNSTWQEINAEGEPGLRMLKEILDQISALQSELRNHKTKSNPDAPSLDSLSEAMLHFWL